MAGIQRPSPGDFSPRGLYYIQMLKPGLVNARWCEAGDIIKIERVSISIMPVDNRLSEQLADYLIKIGKARAYQLKPGDIVVSTGGTERVPLKSGNEWAELEAATDPRPKAAEKALSQRGKGAM